MAADKETEQKTEGGYELDLDDTISAWDQVVEEAVAAVDQDDGDNDENDAEAENADAEAPQEAPSAKVDEDSSDDSGDRDGANLEDSAEAKSLRDQLLRTLADFDNFRKRTEREKDGIKRFALFDVLKDFLDVSDNLDRALAASGSADDLKVGVQMISRQLSDLLRRYGVEPVEAIGQSFDPTVHEAVSREERDDVDEPTVTAELQRGYKLHERLLRPAMVSVAMPAPRSEPEAVDESDDLETQDAETKSSAESAQRDAEEKDEELDEKLAQTTEAN